MPRLIAAGLSLTALGDVLWSVLDLMGAGTDVSIADPPWFASYVFLCAASAHGLIQAFPEVRHLAAQDRWMDEAPGQLRDCSFAAGRGRTPCRPHHPH